MTAVFKGPAAALGGAALLLLSATATPAQEEMSAIYSDMDRFHPVYAENGMVATQEEVATRVGLEILQQGGNAVDAAVAVGFALAVTLPRAGNLGGGGFMVIHMADSDETVAIDYREKAPMAATRDMFLDAQGEADPELSRFTHLAVGVPGTVAGMALALERYGTMSLQEVTQPAIELASEGIVVGRDLAESLAALKERFQKSEASMDIFFKQGGEPYRPGDVLVQSDLAASLRLIAERGPSAFYGGPIAEKIVAEMERGGGLITREDLRAYEPVVREPVRGDYRGYEILSMPPPSSGGVHVVQILNILEDYPIGFLGHNSADTIHLMAEAMRLAYADRSKWLGDPDFEDIPVEGLTSEDYAAVLRAGISRASAAASEEVAPGTPPPYESEDTTHYSIVDEDGNAVANTYTINFSYGTGITAAGTGILLNNEMDDFSAKPGVPNAYGLIGGEFNAVEPEKRPLSSMTPTIVQKDGEPFLVTGSPGGSRIITTVLQVIMNVVDHGMNAQEAVNAVRVHHQWLPDELRVEEGLNPDTQAILEQRGHAVVVMDTMGSAQTVMADDGGVFGAADPRRPGALALGY